MPIVQVKSSGKWESSVSYINVADTLLQSQTFLNLIDEIIPENERKSTSESIKILMNSHGYHVNQRVMKFASSCRGIRNTLLISNESDVA